MPYRVSLVAGPMDGSVNSQSQVEIEQSQDRGKRINIKLLQGEKFPNKELHAAATVLQNYLLEDNWSDHAFIYVSNGEYELKVPTGSTAFAFVCGTLFYDFFNDHAMVNNCIRERIYNVSSNKNKFIALSRQLVEGIDTDKEEIVLRYKFADLIDSIFFVNTGVTGETAVAVTRKTTVEDLLALGRCVDKLLKFDADWVESLTVSSCLCELKRYSNLGATVTKEQASELHAIVERIESFMPSEDVVVEQTVARAATQEVGLFAASRRSGSTNTGSGIVEEDVDDERKVAGLGASSSAS